MPLESEFFFLKCRTLVNIVQGMVNNIFKLKSNIDSETDNQNAETDLLSETKISEVIENDYINTDVSDHEYDYDSEDAENNPEASDVFNKPAVQIKNEADPLSVNELSLSMSESPLSISTNIEPLENNIETVEEFNTINDDYHDMLFDSESYEDQDSEGKYIFYFFQDKN